MRAAREAIQMRLRSKESGAAASETGAGPARGKITVIDLYIICSAICRKLPHRIILQSLAGAKRFLVHIIFLKFYILSVPKNFKLPYTLESPLFSRKLNTKEPRRGSLFKYIHLLEQFVF